MQAKLSSVVFCVLVSLATLAAAQTAPAGKANAALAPATSDARCQREVREYVETLKFIRQSAGEQTGDKVAARYIGEPELQRVIAAQGPCAAAQLIREKASARSTS